MRGVTKARLVVGAAAASLILAGCGGGKAPGSASSPGADNAPVGGELRIELREPRHLVPSNSTESEGSSIVRSVFTGLIQYDAESTKPYNVMAEDIATADSKVWTIKIKKGWTFHNGEPVDADSFIRAWNTGAYAPNAQVGTAFFDRIEGYDDLQGKEPKAKEMSGLKKLDDYSFQVTLKKAFVGFRVVLGYNAYLPMAKACAADLKACDDAPIGNGPYKMDGKWDHNKQIKLVRYENYGGTKGKLDKLTFRIYEKIDTAYNDFVAGNIDVMRSLPPAKVKEARTKFPGRLIEKENPTFTYLGFPVYDQNLADKRVRQAISLSIDRQAIIDAVFDGRFATASSFTASSIPGYKANTCKYCGKDVDKAKKLLADAGGWKGGKLQLWFNAGAGHEVWMQAVGDQIKSALGIDYELKGDLQFAQYLQNMDGKKMTGPFRAGWIPDYPLIENYLKPLYGTKGSSNYSGFSNPDVDSAIAAGDSSKTLDEAYPQYQKGEDVVAEEMPVSPLWWGKSSILYSADAGAPVFNPFTTLEYGKLYAKKK